MANYYFNDAPDINKLKTEREMLLEYANRIDGMISKYEAPKEATQPQWIPNENCFVYGKKEVWNSFIENELKMTPAEFDETYNLFCEVWLENKNKEKEAKKQAYREILHNNNKGELFNENK